MANHQAAAEVLGGKNAVFQATFGVVSEDVSPLSSLIDCVQTDQHDVTVTPSGDTHYPPTVRVRPGEFISPNQNLPFFRYGKDLVVTHTLASALMVEYVTDLRAVAVLEASNFRPVAEALKKAGCDIIIFHENFDLSRAYARDAARATGARIVQMVAEHGRNITEALARSMAEINEHYPHLADQIARARDMTIAFDEIVRKPIDRAQPWTPGMGRSERIADVSRAMSTDAEIER